MFSEIQKVDAAYAENMFQGMVTAPGCFECTAKWATEYLRLHPHLSTFSFTYRGIMLVVTLACTIRDVVRRFEQACYARHPRFAR